MPMGEPIQEIKRKKKKYSHFVSIVLFRFIRVSDTISSFYPPSFLTIPSVTVYSYLQNSISPCIVAPSMYIRSLWSKEKKIVKNIKMIIRFFLSSYSRNTRAVRYESASNANVFIVSRVLTQRIYYTDRVQISQFQDSSHRRFLIINHGAHFPFR